MSAINRGVYTKYAILFILLIIGQFAYAQAPTDCDGPNGAVGICSNSNLSDNSNGNGGNDFGSPSNDIGCLEEGEHQSAWYLIQIESGNTLGFVIQPNFNDDYDFAVYGPNKTCDKLGRPIRCSYAYGTSATGLSASATGTSESDQGDGFVSLINVSPGDSYYILIDNYSQSNQGFNLEWTGGAALSCDVTEPCPTVDIPEDTVTTCSGINVEIGVNSVAGVTYLWNTGATTSKIDVSTEGWYILEATKTTCTVSDSVYVSAGDAPIVDLGNDSIACDGSTILLDANVANAIDYLWQDGSTLPILAATQTGTYSVKVSNDDCVVEDEIKLTFEAKISFDLGSDTAVCDNSGLVLDASSFNTGVTYTWQDMSSGPTYSVDQTGIYYVNASGAACKATDTIEVTIKNATVVDIGEDATYCEGEPITLDASAAGAISYQWQDNSTNSSFSPTISGTYFVVIDDGDCVSSDTVELTFLEYPDFELPNDTNLCGGGNLNLSVNAPQATAYTWQDNSTNNSYNVSGPGTYWVTATNNNICSTTDSIVVTYNSIDVDLGADATYCEDTTITLDATNSGSITYLWQDNSTAPTLEVSNSGIYYVAVSNGECEVNDTIELTFLAYPDFELHPDTTLCDGDTLVLNVSSPDATDFLWQDGSANSSFQVFEEGTYFVQASNQFCTRFDTTEILFNRANVVELGPDSILCKGEDYILDVGERADDVIITWWDNSNENTSSISETGTYYVSLENQCGINSDTVNLLFGSCNCDFFLPTGFTPNGDGVNEDFKPYVDCDSLTEYSFEVFNRWGEPQFRSESVEKAWQGTDNSGNRLPMAVYTWIIQYKWTWRGEEMSNTESGSIMILK